MCHFSEKPTFQAFPIIPFFYPKFLLSSNFSLTFYPAMLFALKYFSGSRFNRKVSSLDSLAWSIYGFVLSFFYLSNFFTLNFSSLVYIWFLISGDLLF